MKSTFHFLLIIVVVTFFSCQDEFESPPILQNIGFSHFPIKKGREYIYSSDSIIYGNGGARRDTFHSFIREVIGDSTVNLDGTVDYQIYRYFRRDTSIMWEPTNRWTMSKTSTHAYRTEENLKFVKMVYPMTAGKTWNANIYFDENQKVQIGGELFSIYNGWKSKLINLDAVVRLNNTQVKAMQIELVDLTSVIEKRLANEWYIDGIGLARREFTVLNADNSRPNDPWVVKAQKGFIHELQLISVK